jgi:cell division septation protein DedD
MIQQDGGPTLRAEQAVPRSEATPLFSRAHDAPAQGRRAWIPAASVGCAVLVFSAIVWFAYDRGRAGTGGPPPLIRADTAPTKMKPEQPGGAQVPYQDTMVYDRLQPGAEKNRKQPVESLLPPPETPLPRPEPTHQLDKPIETLAPAPAVAAAAPAALPPPAPVAPAPAQPTPATAKLPEAPKPRVDTGSPVALAPPTASKAPPAALSQPQPQAAQPQPAAVKANEAGAGWRLQLGAVTSEAAARATFAKLQAAHREVLGKLSLQIEPVQTGGATLYRVKAGPIDAAAAKEACAKLVTQKVPCLAR